MGKRNRERIDRILAGKEKSISDRDRGSIIKKAMSTVQSYSHNNQVKFLADSLHSGHLSAAKLKKVLSTNAIHEMHKGYDRMAREGKKVTVDLLLAEYNKDSDFQKLAAEVGLDRQWFVTLAETEIDKPELLAGV